MSSAALVLVLSSAFFHALWNALLKRHEDPESAVVGVITVTVVCGARWALGLEGAAFPSSAALGWSLGAGVLESGYRIALARALRRAPLGLAYTVSRGGALLLVWPVSVLWLDERLTLESMARVLFESAASGRPLFCRAEWPPRSPQRAAVAIKRA
ncbi:MAG TPA: hypothetical protein VEU33_01830 [Archangium sp.]|nr:hypothetical protein [Archangium sp.]